MKDSHHFHLSIFKIVTHLITIVNNHYKNLFHNNNIFKKVVFVHFGELELCHVPAFQAHLTCGIVDVGLSDGVDESGVEGVVDNWGVGICDVGSSVREGIPI